MRDRAGDSQTREITETRDNNTQLNVEHPGSSAENIAAKLGVVGYLAYDSATTIHEETSDNEYPINFIGDALQYAGSDEVRQKASEAMYRVAEELSENSDLFSDGLEVVHSLL
jgi:hypothetical protein